MPEKIHYHILSYVSAGKDKFPNNPIGQLQDIII
jgi:hypothetical protein